MRRTTRFAIAVLLLESMTMMSSHAATITVTNTNDSGPGSLRQALAVAHDGDRITSAVSGAISLTSGGLGVTKNVTISGPGAGQLSIDGNQGQSVFFVAAIATISGLTIRNGQDGIDNVGILTVRNCVIRDNSSDGISNVTGTSLTVFSSNVSDNDGSGIGINVSDGGASATIVNTTVSGNSAGGIMTSAFFGGAAVTVTDSTISSNLGYGGIYGVLSLTVANSTISNNSSGGRGGGIFAFQNVSIVNSTISGNAGTSGGGIYCNGSQDSSIVNSTISGNSAGTNGGGIYSVDGVTIVNSTISGNSAGTSGGGIYGQFGVSLVNSTISGNSAGTSGGGIYNFVSFLHVANSTISGNSAGSGGGIYNDGDDLVEISNTILNAGALGANVFNNGGTVTSLGYNLSSDDGGGYLNGPGDQINIDPLLGPLQNNGGSTFTHALLPGSPAIDAGDPNFTPPPSNDQRDCHFDRVFNGRIDIGSFEVQPPRRPCSTPRLRPTPPPRP
jgi:predicted outer membrane repeat protein